MEQKVTIAGMKIDDTKRLTNRIEVCIGMLVMVTLNLATEADLANGSRGIIEDIVLDPREEADNLQPTDEGIIWLQYPPAMILFRPFHYEFEPFPGFEPGLIPIFPSERNFNIHYRQNPKTKVYRRQYPLCAAYAFTDHKSQGQTIGYVIVDISPTKKFPVTPFAAYVALSRSRGRSSIRLLRDFDDSIFTQHPSEALRLEDERLEWLAKDTEDKFEAGYYNYN
jgi:ATP-dependent exoDNAse (exonuclease V) alpha subunit